MYAQADNDRFLTGPQCGEKTTGRWPSSPTVRRGLEDGDEGFHVSGSGHGNVSLDGGESFGRDQEL